MFYSGMFMTDISKCTKKINTVLINFQFHYVCVFSPFPTAVNLHPENKQWIAREKKRKKNSGTAGYKKG